MFWETKWLGQRKIIKLNTTYCILKNEEAFISLRHLLEVQTNNGPDLVRATGQIRLTLLTFCIPIY